ncbi:putative 7alpha-cephem-methoxylase P8 chain [Cladorrhinum samala]|uniref:7alpha-cephem-methoxylase P8 chain n=1 Tax=Cladorrhinum samala TaxID=585594 RepID=A0AAV9HE45_9PEZI|nr:putative 7alpha-cephem-methoxylase P8 chain [Cladorrhinum samala]
MSPPQTLHPHGDVLAPLNFYLAPEDGSKPYNNADLPPNLPPRNYGSVSHPVLIRDVRGSEAQYNLDTHSFQVLLSQPPSHPSLDFTSDSSIKEHYYPEITSLLHKTIPGAKRIIIFDHTVRLSSPDAPRAPVQRVHIDQTPLSAAQRVRRHITDPDEAGALLSGRYRIINVWKPLNKNPVETFPLAFAASDSLRDEEMIPVEHRYTSTGYIGQTAAIAHHPDQKWYYLSGMTSDERLLLQCFDSEGLKEGSRVKGGRLAHTAFEDPRSREGAEGRESIEVRCLIFE